MDWATFVIQWLHVLLGIFWFGNAIAVAVIFIPAISTLPIPTQRQVGGHYAERSSAPLLWRLRGSERRPRLYPTRQVFILSNTCGSDVHHAPHRPPGKVHRACVRPRDGIVVGVRTQPDHEVVVDDADGHPIADHERDPSEHLLLGDVVAVSEHSSDPLGQRFVVRH